MIVLFFLAFFAISCAPKQSQPTFIPFMVLGSTETPTPTVATPVPLLSDTIRVTYVSTSTGIDTIKLGIVAEYDLAGDEDTFLPQDLDVEALEQAKTSHPVEGLGVLIQEGISKSVQYTDAQGRLTLEITSLSVTSFYLPEWTCSEVATWELPGDAENQSVRGATLTCQKN